MIHPEANLFSSSISLAFGEVPGIGFSRAFCLVFVAVIFLLLFTRIPVASRKEGSAERIGCLLFLLPLLFPFFFVVREFSAYVAKAKYLSEASPVCEQFRTRVDLYQNETGRLPFDETEVATALTWKKEGKRIDGQAIGYEVVHFALDGAMADVSPSTNMVISRLKMNVAEFQGRSLSPDQVQIACLAPGGVSESGATNAYAYAIGIFGNDEGFQTGTGYAELEAFFPDVSVSSETNGIAGFRLSARWIAPYLPREGEEHSCNLPETGKRYSRPQNSSPIDGQILFGLVAEEGICMLIPPEAFKPGAVTKLRGDGPDSVEYWVERLRAAPCGRWEIPELPKQ